MCGTCNYSLLYLQLHKKTFFYDKNSTKVKLKDVTRLILCMEFVTLKEIPLLTCFVKLLGNIRHFLY